MIAWLDLETTGLEPKTGSILEIALVLTHDELLSAYSFVSLVRPINGRFREVMDDYVVGMHTKSGLLDELAACDAETCVTVETNAINWLKLTLLDCDQLLKNIPLGGNSVHFDRAWIKEHMPKIEALFSHRNVDCSTLNELCKRWNPTIHAARPNATGTPVHRALADVNESIELAKYYRENLFALAEPKKK